MTSYNNVTVTAILPLALVHSTAIEPEKRHKKKATKVTTIFLLYPQKYLSVSILYILRVEGNCSLCFLARRGESFSLGTGLGTSLPRSRFLDVTQRSPIQAAQTARRQSYMHTLFNVPMRGA